jgi:heme A synthase
MRFDLDPTPLKACIIGILLFLESMCGGLLVILQRGEIPTVLEALTVLMVATLALITYLMAFLHGNETQTGSETA